MPWNDVDTLLTGELVTAAMWEEVREDLAFLEEVAYQQFTSNAGGTATAEGSADTIVSAGAVTYEAVPHMIEFYCVRAAAGVAALRVALFDGSTNLGLIASLDASQVVTPLRAVRRHTPSAASHTFSVRSWSASAATSTFAAGAGGTGTTLMPGFIRVTRLPT